MGLAAIAGTAAVAWSGVGAATVPQYLTEQGRLFDSTGQPVSGAVTLKFAIYDAPTGGTQKWTEAQTITLDSGYFSAELGSVAALPAGLFDTATGTLYLGVTVGNDTEISPRQPMLSVPYALVANNAVGDITPKSVSIGSTLVINSSGQWVGPNTGLVGPTGPAGTNGTNGTNGATGPTGPAGTNGTNGTNGAPGPTGPAGTNGTNGTNGAPGPTGPTGPTGPAGSGGGGGSAKYVEMSGGLGFSGTATMLSTTATFPGAGEAVAKVGGFCNAPTLASSVTGLQASVEMDGTSQTGIGKGDFEFTPVGTGISTVVAYVYGTMSTVRGFVLSGAGQHTFNVVVSNPWSASAGNACWLSLEIEYFPAVLPN
jgi:hypothetical protein